MEQREVMIWGHFSAKTEMGSKLLIYSTGSFLYSVNFFLGLFPGDDMLMNYSVQSEKLSEI